MGSEMCIRDRATNEEEDSKEKKDEKEEVIDAEFTDK